MEDTSHILENNPRAQELHLRLRRLPARHNVAFCAWCCDELLPVSTAFAQETGLLDGSWIPGIVERVWRHVAGTPFPHADADAIIAQLDALEFPENLDSPYEEGAEAEFNALWLALLACKANPVPMAVRAGCVLYNLTWGEVFSTAAEGVEVITPEHWARLRPLVHAHPTVAAARQKQADFLTRLEQISDWNPAVISKLRAEFSLGTP